MSGIKEYMAAWASGDMERLQAVLAPDFIFSVDGEDCSVARDDIRAFYKNSREQANIQTMSFLDYRTLHQLEKRGGPDGSYANYRKTKKVVAKEVNTGCPKKKFIIEFWWWLRLAAWSTRAYRETANCTRIACTG